MNIQQSKKAAAEKAVSYVRDNMVVGLGSGSTAYYAIQLIGRKVKNGLKIQGVPTSLETEKLAMENNIPLLSEFERIDITIDGTDEVDKHGNLIKGGGGAHTREKIVAAATQKEIIIVDESKLVKILGNFPLPVEVIPFGWKFVQKQIQALGYESSLRMKGEKVFVTDNQNYILDCACKNIPDPAKLTIELNCIPGVLENGLFVKLTNLVIVGNEDGATRVINFNKQ